MATGNPFDLLGDDDNDDPSQLIAAQKLIISSKKVQAPTQAHAPKPAGKLPSKPLPPAQAVREAKTETGRGGGRGGGRGYGRDRGRSGAGGGVFNRDTVTDNSSDSSVISRVQGGTEELDTWKSSERRGGYGGSHGSFRGGRRGAFGNGEDEDGEHPRRVFERHSGTGQGNEFKREGFGRGNWGTPSDEIAPVAEEVVNEDEKNLIVEKPSGERDDNENPAKEEEKEPENKEEMTLEEYEKVLEEKRKALQQADKTEERKVDGKEFASMQQLSSKKGNDEIFVKLGSDKEKRKEFSDKEDKFKKPVSINEFLKPVEGERHFNPGGRGRGRGPGSGSRGGYVGGRTSIPMSSNVAAPKIEDPGQFPTLGAK